MKTITCFLVLFVIYVTLLNAQQRTIPVDGTAYHTSWCGNVYGGWDWITIEGTPGITWLKIAARGAGPGRAWETATMVIYDGVPIVGQRIIVPKSPPPCVGCGPERVTTLHFFVWGQGELRVNLKPVTYQDDNVSEGQFINTEDPDGRIQGMGSITLEPPNAQAGNDVNIRVFIPSRLLVHVGSVDLILPAPTPQDIHRQRRVTLPVDPDGIYDFTWTVPNQYFSQPNVWDVNKGIRFEVFGNKPNAGGQIPRLTSGYAEIKIAGLLSISTGAQGRTVANGGAAEWMNNRELSVFARARFGRGPYNCVWIIDGEEYTGTGPDNGVFEFKDQKVLRTANSITAVVTDANGNAAASSYAVSIKTDMSVEMVVQGRDIPLNDSTEWKDGFRRVVARFKNGERPIRYRWIFDNGRYVTNWQEANPNTRQVSFEDREQLKDTLTVTVEFMDANNVLVRGTIYINRGPVKDDKDKEPDGPAGPPPLPPPPAGDPSMGAHPDVDWDRPWLDPRVQQCTREYLQNIVLSMANERRKWENTGRSKNKQQPLFTDIDDWGRVLNQYITADAPVQGNWENPTHFVWDEFNKVYAQNLFGKTVEYYVKYECNSLLPPKKSDMEKAIDDLTQEGLSDPCQKDSIQRELLAINNGLLLSQAYYASFIQFYDKIMNEINNQKSDPGSNDLIAYSLVSAHNQLDFHTGNLEDVSPIGTNLISRSGQCPEDIDMFQIIRMLSEVNTRQEDMITKMDEMELLLESYGVDLEETMQQGNQLAQQNADPNWVQDGGLGVEFLGDGIDNIASGLQDQILNASNQGNVVIILYDAGDVRDDVFSLVVDGRNRGDTDPGDYRIYTLNDLSPGHHEVMIIGRKTDVGKCTYGIIIKESFNPIPLLEIPFIKLEVNAEDTHDIEVSGN